MGITDELKRLFRDGLRGLVRWGAIRRANAQARAEANKASEEDEGDLGFTALEQE